MRTFLILFVVFVFGSGLYAEGEPSLSLSVDPVGLLREDFKSLTATLEIRFSEGLSVAVPFSSIESDTLTGYSTGFFLRGYSLNTALKGFFFGLGVKCFYPENDDLLYGTAFNIGYKFTPGKLFIFEPIAGYELIFTEPSTGQWRIGINTGFAL